MRRLLLGLGGLLFTVAVVEMYVALWTESAKHGDSALLTLILATATTLSGIFLDD